MKSTAARRLQTNKKFNQSQGVVIRAYCARRMWQAHVSVGICTHTHTLTLNIKHTVSLVRLCSLTHKRCVCVCVFYTYLLKSTDTHTHTHLMHSTLHCHGAGTFSRVSFPLQSVSLQTERVTSWSAVYAFNTQIRANWRDHWTWRCSPQHTGRPLIPSRRLGYKSCCWRLSSVCSIIWCSAVVQCAQFIT